MTARAMGVGVTLAVCGLTGCLALSSPGEGVAHNDREYCQLLSEMYGRYLGGDELAQRGNAGGSTLEGRIAVAKCQQGDTAAAIPALERLLIANGFGLPRRA